MAKQSIEYQSKPLFPKILWNRPVHFYKNEAGKILVLAGSKGMTGAAILTCEAVFRSGTGILLLGFPKSLKQIYKEILPEAMTLELPETPSISIAKKAEDEILNQAKSCDVVVMGPGLSTNAETIQVIWQLLFEIDKPIVLDADGVTALAKGIEVMRTKESTEFAEDYLNKVKNQLVITPHPGEAAKILNAFKYKEFKGIKAEYVEEHKTEIALYLANKLNAIVVLKGHDSVIAEPNGRVVVNRVGGPELAAAGTGDVLSGIVGSFIGQAPKQIFEAVVTAVYLHGLAGKIAKEKVGERSVIASDVIRYLPEAIKQAEEE
jgi:NAD(P)H-hydrate epimerase